jgi:hypothetical protein
MRLASWLHNWNDGMLEYWNIGLKRGKKKEPSFHHSKSRGYSVSIEIPRHYKKTTERQFDEIQEHR